MIYFIKSESGHVKIGYTSNGIESRLASLQSGCPFELTLLKTCDGSMYQEKALHRKFRKYHDRLEWFFLTEEIEEFIKNPVLVKDKPEEPIKYLKKRAVRHLEAMIFIEDMQKLIDKLGSKQAAAEKLMISLRYVDMILAGKQPSKRLVQLIKIHISMG